MPLHDWSDRPGWEGLHIYWMTEIARDLKHRLPPGFRAVIGSSPLVAIGLAPVKPDVSVTNGIHSLVTETTTQVTEPDIEIAVSTLEEDTTVLVEREGRLIAAVELISPRNKDRPAAREQYAARYGNYLRGGVHLLLVDVHRRPVQFSFAGQIAASLGESISSPSAPCAVSYRVGGPAALGGRMLAVWQRALTVGDALPAMLLPLGPELMVSVDLEGTYNRAAGDSYLEDPNA
ncbi:DUF4058 family protein [Zavarzinella formosa]|uniref:DUF4058 family protein n=1 Tax=Zavarzinella formosa TaxID=360055 RepID=UPI0002DD3DF1|nr:DUF4058 family protein [Zavarzinella formosa]